MRRNDANALREMTTANAFGLSLLSGGCISLLLRVADTLDALTTELAEARVERDMWRWRAEAFDAAVLAGPRPLTRQLHIAHLAMRGISTPPAATVSPEPTVPGEG